MTKLLPKIKLRDKLYIFPKKYIFGKFIKIKKETNL